MDAEPTPRLMVRALRVLDEGLRDWLDAEGFPDVTVAQAGILRALSPDGMRQVDVAREVGITKQAVSQAVGVLAARGLVTVEADPDDARAVRVGFAPRGARVAERTLAYLTSVEDQWEQQLGGEAYAVLRDSLWRLTRD